MTDGGNRNHYGELKKDSKRTHACDNMSLSLPVTEDQHYLEH